MMLRWKSLVVAAVFVVSFPLAACADNFALVGGEFTFTHAPVDLENPNAIEFDPLRLYFNVPSESFHGQLVAANLRLPILNKGLNFPGKGLPFQRLHLPFSGEGLATGCVYPYPTSTLTGEFTGSFVWLTPDGELHGTFYLQDHYIGFDHMMGATICISFIGGTERFANASGEALAIGFDLLGGLGGDPATAGVVAAIITGNLRIN